MHGESSACEEERKKETIPTGRSFVEVGKRKRDDRQSANGGGTYLMPRAFNACAYFAAFFRCSPYVSAKLWLPEKSSFAHM